MATKASRIALAGSNISSTGEVDADLLDNIDSAAFLSLDGNDRLGIGETSPLGKLHVKDGDAGSITTNGAHDTVVIEGSGNTGINIFSPNTSYQYLAFGDTEGSNSGYVRYQHSNNQMVLRAGSSDTVYINDGKVGIGTTGPSAKLTITDENAGQAMLQVRNFSTSATGSFGNAHSVELRSATSTTTHGVLIHHHENAIGRRSLDVSDANGIFASFVQGKVGIGNTNPNNPLTITANSGANGLALRARTNDDYAFLQFYNNAGTTLRGQIYNNNGSIGFTTGTDSSAGDDLYISDSGGVGINTTTTGNYNGRLTVYQDTHDAYTPTDFLDKPTMQLRHTANTNGYTGTRYANNTGTYEWFTGAHQFDGQRADFVVQGYDRDLNGYRENQRIYDTGQIVQPRQPSFQAHKTSHLSLSGSGYSEAGGWSTSYVNGAHNVGGHFNTSTGRFTAPVAGRYKFDANIMHGITSGDYQIWLCVNGNTNTCIKSNSMQSTGGNWKQTTVTGIFNLAVSDYISIFIRSSTAEPYAIYGNTTNAFTTCNGYLIG